MISFFGIFSEKNEKGDEKPAKTTDTVLKDYSGFAKGSPIFTTDDISVSAKSVLLCTDSGLLLYEKQADVPLPMASITKVMTATVALEALGVFGSEQADNLKKEVTVDADAVGVEGSSVYLKAGERVSYEMLLYSLMLESANDAAEAIAIAVMGSEEAFVRAMNEKAAALCMKTTVFKNPHGLSEDGHYTTARDFARLMAYAIENPVFCQLIGTKKAVYPSSDGEMTRVLTNHNRLLNTYRNMLGGKTGFTKISGRTLVTAAEKDGTRLICVTINAPDDWNDHVSLFEKGFDAVKTEVFTPESCSAKISVACGSAEALDCFIKRSVRLTVKRETEITVKLFCPGIIFAPIKADTEIGRAEFYADGEMIAEERLYAKNEVYGVKAEKSSFFSKITDFLGIKKEKTQ